MLLNKSGHTETGFWNSNPVDVATSRMLGSCFSLYKKYVVSMCSVALWLSYKIQFKNLKCVQLFSELCIEDI
jgi:hypothetical protein